LSVDVLFTHPLRPQSIQIWICDLAGRKGWGTHGVVRDSKEKVRADLAFSNRGLFQAIAGAKNHRDLVDFD